MNTSSSTFNFDLAVNEAGSLTLWIQTATEKLHSLGSPNYGELMLSLVLLLIPISLGAFFWKKSRGARQVLLGTAFAILLIRGLLFVNPVSWVVYRSLFDWQDIGFREKAVIDFELRKYIQPANDIEFLALGSSQTGAIYQELARERRDVYKLEFAGMNAIDMYLYSGILNEIKPRRLLLFVSEFDLAREPELATLKYAPFQPPEKYRNIVQFLSQKFGWTTGLNTAAKMLIANFLPENKHRYIPIAFVDKLVRKRSFTLTSADAHEMKSRKEVTQEQIQGLQTSLQPPPIEDNFRFLSKFVDYATEQGIVVYLVEGQYHPDAYTEHTNSLNKRVKYLLSSLGKLDNVRFISREESYLFNPSDFTDGYHPSSEAAKKFIKKLFEHMATIENGYDSPNQ